MILETKSERTYWKWDTRDAESFDIALLQSLSQEALSILPTVSHITRGTKDEDAAAHAAVFYLQTSLPC